MIDPTDHGFVTDLEEEVKRLREINLKLEAQRDSGWVHPEEVKAEINALQDENDNLRAKLEDMALELRDAKQSSQFNRESYEGRTNQLNEAVYCLGVLLDARTSEVDVIKEIDAVTLANKLLEKYETRS